MALGQIRDLDPTHINQFSIVLVNDGAGHYPARVELPHPAFNDGYTAAHALTHFDVNADGFEDLLLVHQRNDDGPPGVIPWTGRYVQALVNRGTPSGVLRRRRALSFGDETPTWLSDQRATTPERNPNGDELSNFAEPAMHDVDGDGCPDLVMSRSLTRVRVESPLVYRNNGSGQFRAMPPDPFAGFSFYAVPMDANGDNAIDFVVLERDDGPDGRFNTGDDVSTLVTHVNATPAGPVRCG